MRRPSLFVLCICALTTVAGCGQPNKADQAKPFRIGWVQAMANAPAIVAEQEGFYRAEGLDVQLKAFPDGPLIQQALAAGQLDAAYVGAAPVFQWAQRGLNARILAKVNTGQASLIARMDGPVNSLATLRGAKVASPSRGSGMDVMLRAFVLQQDAKLDPDKDLTIVNMPAANMSQAMAAKRVDAMFTWEPFVSQALLRGDTRLLLDMAQALPGHPWYVVIARAGALKDRPDDVLRLLRAHHRATAFMNDHPAQADAIIVKAFKLRPIARKDGSTIAPERIVAEARKRVSWSDRLSDSDIAFFQRQIGWSRSLGYLTKPISAASITDRSYAEKAAR
jgi:NitT/TauT family transport system substrate-binding protein